MSDDQAQRPQTTSHAKPSHSKGGSSNKAGMLLAGAAALALLLGGGYYAFKHAAPNQTSSEIADNSSTFTQPTQDQTASNDATGLNGAPATTDTSSTEATDSAAAKPAKKRVVAAAVPEETIGVSRVTNASSQSDEVVVNPLHRPVWRYTPRADRLAEYYPEAALDRGREGEASLHCIVQKKGALDCEQISESPARSGFGTAALRVSRTLRHSDQLANGKNAIGTPLNLHVVFRMAEGERRASRS